MHRRAITPLRVSLLVLLLGSILAQLLVPVAAAGVEETFPEVGYLVVPYSVAGIIVIACGQVALLVVWRLLSMISGGAIFTGRALHWVDVLTACGTVATIVNAAVWVHLLSVHGGGPGIILWLLASTAFGMTFVLLMLVMRGLLEAAVADRTELDEVI